MKKNNLDIDKLLKSSFCGFLPIYGADGTNGSKLLFSNVPPIYDKRQVRSILNDITAYFQKDIKLIRKYVSGITGLKNINPLPIASNILLIPFKTRKPVGKDDGATGYILDTAILNVEEILVGDKTEVRIILEDKSPVHILDNYYTAKRRLKTANMLRNIISYDNIYKTSNNIFTYRNTAPFMVGETNEIYSKPATKGDIVLLSQSIQNIISLANRLKG